MLYVFFINLVQLNIGRREYIGLHKQSSRPGQASQVAHERRPALEHGTYVPSPVPASVAAGDGRGWTVEQLAAFRELSHRRVVPFPTTHG